MKASEIRSRFLAFFEARGHRRFPSASLIPADDPTVLFTPAGMSPFKPYFLGIQRDVSRAVSSQKCLRTADIDKVGRTAAHHTFFEMLGNFSFGDYGKREAIRWAWEFLVADLRIPPERLGVSVFEEDAESFAVWREVGLPEGRIWRYGMGENFWPPNAPAEGPNGPCGPCSEIFYDSGAEYGCNTPTCHVNCDCRRHVEIWNLVFTQYERKGNGTLVPLPRANIDTGAGLERLAAVLQGVRSNFDSDLFRPILKAVAEMAGRPYEEASESGARARRIADHVRACVFCVADGILPTNEGRGYVERRLIRRALRDGMQMGLTPPFLHALVGVVVSCMRDAYPELAAAEPRVVEAIKTEEERFQETLRLGMDRLGQAIERMRQAGSRTLSGLDAFKLYDTYGLPIDILSDALHEQGMEADIAGFERAMEEQRKTARGANPMTGDIFAAGGWAPLAAVASSTKFLGYAKESVEAKVLAILPGHAGESGELVREARAGQEVTALLDKTPFYGEAGGQIGDTGRLRGRDIEARVLDTQRAADLILHKVRVESGVLAVGRKVTAEVDRFRRAAIRRHHTATHLLHAALREVLGPEAAQAGSLVAPDRLRFDFHHDHPLSAEEVERVEDLVSEQILANVPVRAREMPLASAKAEGAVSLFGEKYGDVVRVLSVGRFSTELCGGTHVARTGDIGPCVVTAQASVSAGVRRIEAVAGFAAIRWMGAQRKILARAAVAAGSSWEELPAKVEELRAERKKLAKNLERSRLAGAGPSPGDLVAAAERVAGVPLVAHAIGEGGVSELRAFLDRLKPALGSGAAVLGAAGEGRADLLVYCAPALVVRGAHAAKAAQAAAAVLGGGGGGKSSAAQAGGKSPEKLPEALAAAADAIRAAVGAAS